MKRKFLQLILAAIASMFSLNVSGQLSGYYQEDFEGTFPPANWQTVDVLDAVNVWAQSTIDHYSGANSAYMNFSDMTIQGEDWLILPQFTVTAGDSLSFWLAANYVLYPPDSTLILVSTTDSALSSFTNVIATLSEGVNYPTTADVFKYYAYSLSAFDGQNIYVAIKNRNIYGDGVFIDLLSIGNPVQTVDAIALSIDVPDFITTNTFSPMGTVKNNSLAAQTFTATLTATGGYSSTKDVTNLPAGSIQQVTFDPWTPVAGNPTLSLTTQLAGDVDASNDNISIVVNAFDEFINYGWRIKAAAPAGVYDPALAAMNYSNGTSLLFVLGGSDGGYLLSDVRVFDVVGNSWSSVSGLITANYTSSAVALKNKIYVIGGYNPPFTGIGDNQIYDIATDSWTSGSSMPTIVGDYAFGVYKDSLLYYFGGYDSYAGGAYDVVQIYNPLTDSWTEGTSTPAAIYGWQAGITGNKIVLSGGSDPVNGLVATSYVGTINPSDPTDIAWVQVDDFPGGTVFRGGSGNTIDPLSGLVVFTGGDPEGYGTTFLGQTFAYDVNSDSWKIGPDKPTAVNNLRNLACAVDKDSMYIVAVGGYDGSYPLDVNEWLNLGPAPVIIGITENQFVNFDLASYPNPFSKFTSLTFTLEHSSPVRISVVDVTGKEVEVLCDKTLPAGPQQISWSASHFAAGVYFCKVSVNENVITQKLVKMD